MTKPSALLQLILDSINKLNDNNEKLLIELTKQNGDIKHLKLAVYGDGEEGSGLVKRMNKQEHWRSRIKGVLIALSVLWTMSSVLAGIYYAIH